MNESFGTRLRHERERRQVPLASIALSSKIQLGLLEALENDDVSRWPSGIVRRGFIRSYAQAVGLEPDALVREFLERYPDPLEMDGSLQPSHDLFAVRASAIPAIEQPAGSTAWIARRLRAAMSIRSVTAEGIDSAPVEPAIRPTFAVSRTRREVIAPEVTEPEARVPEVTVPEVIVPVVTAPPQARDQGRSSAVDVERTPDFLGAANLCTSLAGVVEPQEVSPLLGRLAELLDAVGVVVWFSDESGHRLTPLLAWGYPDTMVARMGSVPSTAHNATAAAFRSAQPQIVNAAGSENGAIVIPLITPNGCAGVLAAEVRRGGEQNEWVSAFARIFAAQLAMLFDVSPPCEARRAHA